MTESNQVDEVSFPGNFRVSVQYLKDLSFENPNAPTVFFEIKDKPNINLGIDINVNKLKEKVFEVTLKITASAEVEERTIFITEVHYAGIFLFSPQVAEEDIESILLIDCPTFLFPFIRRIVADVTRDGGFPVLFLEPVDFKTLHERRLLEQKEQETIN